MSWIISINVYLVLVNYFYNIQIEMKSIFCDVVLINFNFEDLIWNFDFIFIKLVQGHLSLEILEWTCDPQIKCYSLRPHHNAMI